MKVALIDKEASYARAENLTVPGVLETEDILRAFEQEYEERRLALLQTCLQFGKRAHRADDDFDVTDEKVFGVGDRVPRHLDICVLSRGFLNRALLEAVKRFLDERAPSYCISIQADPRIMWFPFTDIYLWRERAELRCDGWWTRRKLKRILDKLYA